MSTAALFIRAKKWEHIKHPSTDKWINKMWSIHTIEYDRAIKRNGVLTYATARMNLENITLEQKKPEAADSTFYDSISIKCPE